MIDDRYIIDTPENIAFVYDIAGIGSRFLAGTIDMLLIVFLEVGLAIMINLILSALDLDVASSILVGLLAVVSFLFLWGYYIIFDLVWNGQSPGKRMLGLRVVYEGGRPVSFLGSVIRNLIRIVDFLPFFYGIGVVVMFVDSRARRLGDLAAGTLVVKERREVTLESLLPNQALYLKPVDSDESLPQPTLPNIHLLNERDYTLVQEFLHRRSELGQDARSRLGAQLANGLRTRLGLPYGGDTERFLQYVVIEYQLFKRQQAQNQ